MKANGCHASADELKPAAPPRPNAGPRMGEEAVRKKMETISNHMDEADLDLGRTFRVCVFHELVSPPILSRNSKEILIISNHHCG
jgi:hypothetical protein